MSKETLVVSITKPDEIEAGLDEKRNIEELKLGGCLYFYVKTDMRYKIKASIGTVKKVSSFVEKSFSGPILDYLEIGEQFESVSNFEVQANYIYSKADFDAYFQKITSNLYRSKLAQFMIKDKQELLIDAKPFFCSFDYTVRADVYKLELPEQVPGFLPGMTLNIVIGIFSSEY